MSLNSRKDLSGDIYRQLRRAILNGRLRPGDLLPPTRVLAKHLGVARMTVTVAYERLAGEGFIGSRVGSGTYVQDQIVPLQKRTPHSRFSEALRPRPVWDSVPLSTAFARPARFDFRTGLPDASLFPHDRWRRLLSSGLRESAERLGIYPDPAGDPRLREMIARHICLARGMEVTADDVTIVNGAQQGLDIVAKILVEAGDAVAVEDPGYRPVRWLFESYRARVIGIPVDESGLTVETLPRRARLVYVSPSHQYPLGVSMKLTRRQALLGWAARCDSAIVEDDYDSEFRFEGRPMEPLQTLDRDGRVIYIGSFSKTMLPTLRLGFLVVPRSLRAAVHRAKQVTDWHTAIPLQIALAEFIASGEFSRHIRKMREIYRARRAIVLETLIRDFPGRLQVVPSVAGLHITALAPRATAGEIGSVIRMASEAGVEAQNLATFSTDSSHPSGIVLGYGAIATADIPEGLRLLRQCFDAVKAGRRHSAGARLRD